MNLYLLQMICKGVKQKIALLILLFLFLHQANSIIDLPLCQTCAADDTISCISCAACKTYAILNGAYCVCQGGFYLNNQDSSNLYCDRCHSSCNSCFGPLAGNCITCSDRYVLNQTGSICVPPSNSTDQTLIEAYSFYGFSKLTEWSFSTQTLNTYVTSCGIRSILGGPGVIRGGSIITVSYTVPNIPYHYALRIKMGFYIFNAGGSAAQAWVSLTPAATPLNRTYSNQTTSINSCSGYNFVHFNIDDSFPHDSTTATIQIGLTAYQWFGIRQFYLIAKKCQAKNCSKCAGYLPTQCTVCVDSKRLPNYAINNGTCLCSGVYYQQPYSGQCVDPCPSVPTQYYGDPTTRFCKLTCPATYYALDDTYRCETDCPVTSSKSSYLLFKDNTNRKCVSTCPSTQPYAYTVDRICYSTCPTGTFASDAYNRRCVATCQQDASYKLYAYNGKCIPQCPDGFWADPATVKCIANCSSPSYPFKDNSTGFNLCVSMCPAPNMFGQTTNYYCVSTCPNGTFGQRFDASNAMLQRCIAKCNSPRWGLVTDNRKCVDLCPLDYWGQPTNRVCTNVSTDCNPRYADNYTRQCVAISTCSIGFFSYNITWSCVAVCPNNTYGHPTSKVCQALCDTPLFRDPGINKCVSSCVTLGTYADVESTRTCVPACNTSGTTPWADQSTRTCVSDCNNTITSFLSDNTTWKCVYRCAPNWYADLTTTAPKCVRTCPSNYFADNSTGTGICVQKCSTFPRKFGDATGGLNLCVDVCAAPNLYGDQTGNRICQTSCPNTPIVYYAQNDTERLCVKKCKDKTYGYNNYCLEDPKMCPAGFFGDDSTNLCVNPCPASQGTFGDPVSKLCVRQCPLNPNVSTTGGPNSYYADISNRLCVLTCNNTHLTGLFGNNNTRTCQTKCLDLNSYGQTQTVNRICVARCLTLPAFRYANNDTKLCGTSLMCQNNYYGQNSTQKCVQFCPLGSYAYKTTLIKYCIDICPIDSSLVDWFGDNTTSKRVCVTSCPSLPLRFADPTTKLCVQTCPPLYYGDTVNRKCVTLCPPTYFAHQLTRRCVLKCPDTYFGDDTATVRFCHPNSTLCGARFGDPYLNLCVGTCTGPSPVNLFGSGDDCVSYCPNGTYADSDTGTRLCVANCPNYSGSGGRDLYGDPTTRTCEPKCITPGTWADYQTRDCQANCSALPIPTYSQNFNMKCVISTNCPTSPSMTFGDNTTRTCLSNCTNNQFGDPNSRNCVTQCPKLAVTGTQHYYGDKSTGINLCITICPSMPRLFGDNATNLCVPQCPPPLYGDQQGKRSCVPGCPIVGGVTMYYAQNSSRICVKVCINGTWGLSATRECVQVPTLCGSQWADNTTNMCVTTCPAISNLYADPTTGFCVPLCPATYYSDDKTRSCVQRCPDNNGVHGTFANNQSRVCEQYCSQPNAFSDPQTLNRYCVLLCSQFPFQSFADPSSKSCVKTCPVFPSLYAQTQTFKCISKCITPYYADTHTRRCQLSCPPSQFKLNGTQICVTTCPQNPDLYGDSSSGFCQSTCTNNYHRYPTTRMCIPSCQAVGYFSYNFTCVKYCPYLCYADASGICISPCTSSTYGQNSTTQCRSTCITGYVQGTLCVASCSDGLFGQNKICKNSCTLPLRASNETNLCVANCEAGTYLQNGKCESNCTTGYADPSINQCSPSCSNGRYGDPTTKKCVMTCPDGYYRDATGYCLNDCSPNSRRADNITWNCEPKCSNGTWGHNFKCVTICPPGFYGYTFDRDCYNILNQPLTTLFADNNTQTWVSVCPLSPLRYGDRTKAQCVPSCIVGQLADPSSRQCQTGCTNTSYFADSTNKLCVLICPSGWFANTDNNMCQDKCTGGKFAYQITRQCLNPCPFPYFGYNDLAGTLTCVLRCPNNTYGQGRLCVPGCATLYADDSTNLCVSNCVNSFANIGTHKCQSSCTAFSKFADNSTNTCVSQCPSDPDYYQQNNVCVFNCNSGLFADPTVGTRACRSGCPAPFYAEPQSRRCLPNCKPGYFGRNATRVCQKTCLTGLYADNSTGFCEVGCQAPFFADPQLNQCVQICSGIQFGEGRVCVSKCNAPNYANPLTKKCQLSCPAFDYSFAQNTTRSCVKDCRIVANSYADRNVRICMDACSLTLQYALDSQGKCVSLCPEGLFMDNTTKKCKATCTTGFAEPTSRYCVARCYGAPETYGYTDPNGKKTCVYKCKTSSQNLYADIRTNMCVPTCILPMYSDPLSGNCVAFCPQGMYAQDTDRTCSPGCNSTQFADNLTRSCVNQCPSATQQTFGHFGVQKCLRICPDNYYARNDTKQCVLSTGCKANSWADPISKYCVTRCPSDPLTFGWNTQLKCVPRCSQIQDLYGQFVTQTCVAACDPVNGVQTYQDTFTRTCVFRCPIQQQLWADTTDNRCKRDCSGTQIRDNSTQKCVATCPSNPQSYADTTTKFCVRTCPNGKFASDNVARLCTSNCQTYSFTYGDNTTNKCTAKCPAPYFSDNTTYLCVLYCPQGVDYYADAHSRTCVLNCPKGLTWVSYADPDTRTCVTKCPNGKYAVNSTQRCIPQCPPNQYADLQLNLCVANCTVRPGFYKQINSRVCVPQCPTNLVNTYKYDVNHSCVYQSGGISGCPGPYYANPLNKICTTLCPPGYYAQLSSKMCVTQCQINFVADPTDRTCKSSCTLTPQYYAYDLNKVCVQHCPSPYFNNNQTFRCTQDCTTTPLMFRYYQTRQCVFNCHYPYFAHTPNRTCLLGCPTDYFAQQTTRSCVQVCDSPYFADDSTNRCVDVCPQTPDYYGHLKLCGLTCPNNFYRDNSTRLCVSDCPVFPLLFADNSTNTCVKYCPSSQNFFADNFTRKCVLNCSQGLFADVSTRTCVKTCPKNLQTYADPTTRVCQPTCPGTYFASEVTKQCVQLCPNQPVKTYSHINKCLQRCPQDFYGQNTTRICRSDCTNVNNTFADDTTNLCVTTCPIGLFSQNFTQWCLPQCPKDSFADSTTRKCVEKCPGTQRLYADNTTWRCVSQCPIGWYGDSNTWLCLQSCPNNTGSFRLEVGRLCVQQCPSPFFAFVPTRTCVLSCGNGLYGDPVTRACKDCPAQCPTCLSPNNCLSCISTMYLSYGRCVTQCILNNEVANYANEQTRVCGIAIKCPAGFYGFNGTKKCIDTCPPQMYKNDSRRTCENCPQHCTACTNLTFCSSCTATSVFSQKDNFCYSYCNSTHLYYLQKSCVSTCPDGTYLDYTAINCQKCNDICFSCFGNALNCTKCFQSFKYEGKCLSQCPQNFYASAGQCLACTPDVQSCANPLSFEVKSTTQNFQPVLVIKFNQQTVANGNPKDFLKVRLTMKRRLQQTQNHQLHIQDRNLQSDMINDGIPFEAVFLPDGSIKLILKPGMSLSDVNFDVSFTDASAIQTKFGGNSLQTLSNTIEVEKVQVYSDDLLTYSQKFKVIGALLAIVIILPVFFLLICSPIAVFQSLQAFQLISLFAYVNQIPPNLFYFLKQLNISRFTFLPSMFASIYKQPFTYSQQIPVKVTLTQGQLSFGMNAGGFSIVGLIYLAIVGIVFLASSKYNNNRPLRNMFNQIYNTRIKYGILHDLLWIFSINIFVSAFMQFRFTQNGGDTALGVITMLGFLVGIVYLGYKMRSYQRIPYQQRQLRLEGRLNMSFYMQGSKQSVTRQHISTAYYVRKILFAMIIAATVLNAYQLAIILLVLQIVMLGYLLILRPYVDNFRNFMHIINQFGIGFIPCGIIYLVKIKQMNEPLGHKMKCGQIMIYVIVAHLSIAIIWAYFRSYFFIKQMIKSFKQTQFFKLYMDEQFEQELQKQIKDLINDEKGDIQSVEMTNFNENDNQDDDEENQVIRLKIKRKRIKNKNYSKIQQTQNEAEDKRYKKDQFIKLDQNKLSQSLINKKTLLNKQQDFQKVSFNGDLSSIQDEADKDKLLKSKEPFQMNKMARKSIHEEQWVVLKLQNQSQQQNRQIENNNLIEIEKKQNQILEDEGYKSQNGIISDMSDEIKLNQNREEQNKIQQIQSSVQNSIINQQEPYLKDNKVKQIQKVKSEDIFDMIQDYQQPQKQQSNQILKDNKVQDKQTLQKAVQKSNQNFEFIQKSNENFEQIQKSNQNFSDLNIMIQNQPNEESLKQVNPIQQNKQQENQSQKYQTEEWNKYQVMDQSQKNSQNNDQEKWEKINQEENKYKTNNMNLSMNDTIENNNKQEEEPHWNTAYKKTKMSPNKFSNKKQQLLRNIEQDNQQEGSQQNKKVNNWTNFQNILGEQKLEEQKLAQKKKIQMMIFDEDDFESENNQHQ